MIIKIFGSQAEGKRTVAKLIETALAKHELSFEFNGEHISEDDMTRNLKQMSESGDFKCEMRLINLKSESRAQYTLKKDKA